MNEKRLAQLKEVLKQLNDGLTKEDFASAFSAVTEYVKGMKNTTEKEVKAIKTAVDNAISRIESVSDSSLSSIKKELTDKAESLMNDIRFEKEAFLAEAQKKLDEVKDGEPGKDADEEIIVEKVLALLPESEEETAEETRDLLESLEGEERLDSSAIKNLPDYNKEINGLHQRLNGQTGYAGANVVVNGSYVGNFRTINFSGAGVTSSISGETLTLSFSGGGGGLTALTATETPDGSRTQFTFPSASAEPSYIVVDNVWMKKTSKAGTVNWTWSGTVATLAVPAQDDIFGIV